MVADGELKKVLEKLESELPQEYAERQAELVRVATAVKTWIAGCLEPALNERINSSQCDTYREKADLAKWINHECRVFGLAVACPVSGRPSTIKADVSGAGGSRFKFWSSDAKGPAVRAPWIRKALPQLHLIPDDPERLHTGKWATKGDR